YGFGPDFSNYHGPVSMENARQDLRFLGELLRQTSTVVLDPVKMVRKNEFKVDPNVSITGDTARLAVKMIEYRKHTRLNFGDMELACHGALEDTSYQVLKFILVRDGTRWLIVTILSPTHEVK